MGYSATGLMMLTCAILAAKWASDLGFRQSAQVLWGLVGLALGPSPCCCSTSGSFASTRPRGCQGVGGDEVILPLPPPLCWQPGCVAWPPTQRMLLREGATMKRLQIPNVLAIVVGLVMVIWGGTLPLHQGDMASQTTGEFIMHIALTIGGVLIALLAFLGLARSAWK